MLAAVTVYHSDQYMDVISVLLTNQTLNMISVLPVQTQLLIPALQISVLLSGLGFAHM